LEQKLFAIEVRLFDFSFQNKYIILILKTLDPEKNCELIANHIKALKSKEPFKHALFVVIPESNLGLEAAWITRYLRTYIPKTDYIVMYEDDIKGEIGPGVRMNKTLKKIISVMFIGVLEGERFKWHKDFLTLNEKITANEMKEKMMTQMKDYRVIIKTPSDKHADATEVYSGKGGRGTDDLMIAMQLNYIMMTRFFDTPEKYQQYWKGSAL
jgi:hypothetical protein